VAHDTGMAGTWTVSKKQEAWDTAELHTAHSGKWGYDIDRTVIL
jgi:hypothetical protein